MKVERSPCAARSALAPGRVGLARFFEAKNIELNSILSRKAIALLTSNKKGQVENLAFFIGGGEKSLRSAKRACSRTGRSRPVFRSEKHRPQLDSLTQGFRLAHLQKKKLGRRPSFVFWRWRESNSRP